MTKKNTMQIHKERVDDANKQKVFLVEKWFETHTSLSKDNYELFTEFVKEFGAKPSR